MRSQLPAKGHHRRKILERGEEEGRYDTYWTILTKWQTQRRRQYPRKTQTKGENFSVGRPLTSEKDKSPE